MNREIKFRGKSTLDGKWVFGSYKKFYGYHVSDIHNHICTYDGANIYEVEENTVGQYTGLKDKNGKEIYEGDILEFVWEEESCWGNEGTYKGFVRYCDGGYEVVYINRQEYTSTENGGKHPNSKSDELQSFIVWTGKLNIEVIGNIFENPTELSLQRESEDK